MKFGEFVFQKILICNKKKLISRNKIKMCIGAENLVNMLQTNKQILKHKNQISLIILGLCVAIFFLIMFPYN
jgi:hypothetical protein